MARKRKNNQEALNLFNGTNLTLNSDVDQDTYMFSSHFVCLFVALRPKSTAMVIAGRSVHLTTLFSGQAWTSG